MGRRQNNPDTEGRLQSFASLPFNPTSLITGQGGFWRADMGVTGSPNVTAWADQSSFANNLAPVNNQPTFSATGFNSAKPGITFVDNGNFDLSKTLAFSSTAVSAFILLQWGASNANANNRVIGLKASGSADFSTNSFTINAGTSNQFSCISSSVEQGDGGSKPTLTASGLYLLGMVFDGANANKWQNGAVVGAGTAQTQTYGANGGDVIAIGTLGGFNTGFTAAFWGITYKAMNSTDWTNLKNWSNTNWGTAF